MYILSKEFSISIDNKGEKKVPPPAPAGLEPATLKQILHQTLSLQPLSDHRLNRCATPLT